ncbi:D-isomer specific 2-hydroxyacid dehydrogenase [Gluconacetobacter johannae DSM 13595]|nr:NAD(P)-dependent oxidoreductase [Gluconacetobacter johannae]GBQ82707.1 D-isomer specific 2-hydroxyacid dehydrogenase [Gluconacetobacter johannae DSM 13595]
MMKISFFAANEAEVVAAAAALGPGFTVGSTALPLDAHIAGNYADSEIVSTFVGCTLSKAVLVQFPKLRLIAVRATGYDNVDLDYCMAHGIVVSTVPAYGDATVAEHAFALLLALSRHLVACVEATRRGEFGYVPARGFELRDKVLGVVGTGRIGRRAIEMAHGFGMKVVAFDAFPSAELKETPAFRYASLPELLSAADIVTLHVPATPETIGLIGDREFDQMKPGAMLINTARGQVVDTPALIRALASGRLGGAGLDVLPQEPLLRREDALFKAGTTETASVLKDVVADHTLTSHPNVLVTPHNAYNTVEAFQRIMDTTLDNIRAFAGGAPANRVA